MATNEIDCKKLECGHCTCLSRDLPENMAGRYCCGCVYDYVTMKGIAVISAAHKWTRLRNAYERKDDSMLEKAAQELSDVVKKFHND